VRPPGEDKTRVQSVDRAAELLQAVAHSAGKGSTARMLAHATGLNRATAWRILRTLESRGLVNCDPRTHQYSIGTALVELAQFAPTDTWSTRAHERLRTLSLQTRETTALALFEDGDLRYVDEVMRAGAPAEESWLGSNADPLHATSSGKVYLAYASQPLRALITEPLERFTDSTVTSVSELEKEVAEVRTLGYGLCRGELLPDLWGVSAPLLTQDRQLLGVLSCWGPASRGEPERFAALGSLIRDAARGLLAR